VESCQCGAPRKKFWLWRDANGVLHASAFAPTTGTVGAVIAATARDALLPLTNGAMPKHVVQDADNPDVVWAGRCAVSATVA
jgi:hypothetical protein